MTINLKKLLTFAFFLSTAVSTNLVNASEQLLASVSTDATTDTYQFTIGVNDEDQTITSLYFDTFTDKKLGHRDELPVDTFIKEGITLPKRGKLNLVRIAGENFDKEQGGMVVIEAVYNILTGKRRDYEFHIAKQKVGWAMFKDGHLVTQVKAVAKKVPVVGIVGVKDLVTEK